MTSFHSRHSDVILDIQTEDRETQTGMDLKEEIQQLKEELTQVKKSVTKMYRDKQEFEQSFIYWMLKVDKRLVMFIGMAAVAMILADLGPMKMSPVTFIKKKAEVVKRKFIPFWDPDVEFSRTRYNANKVHINDEGELINTPDPNPPHSDQRLKKYEGTSSTVPLTQSGSPHYWEVKTQVGIIETLTRNELLLEIGLAREEEQDQHHCIDGQLHSYTLIVSRCSEHSSICTRVWRHGKTLLSLPDSLENTPGASTTLHYGVVYDSSQRRIAFLDLVEGVLIGKIDNVDSCSALWPMFGVYNSNLATVSMKLVVGDEIEMTQIKKGLILESLS